MWNEPTKEQLTKLPALYETENVPLAEKIIGMHFFINGSDWYVAEYGDGLFFGYVILNGDLEMAEWGYFSLEELKQLKSQMGIEVDCDLHWQPKKAGQIPGVKTYEH